MHIGYEDLKSFWNKNKLSITSILAIVAIIISLSMMFSVEYVVERKIKETVSTTKINVAELDAASKLSVALRNLKDNKSYYAFVSVVGGIRSNLFAIYSASGLATSSYQEIVSDFERIIDLANNKSVEVSTSTEALIELLRMEE